MGDVCGPKNAPATFDLGHSSIQVTYDRYGHLFPSDQEALADKMNDVYLGAVGSGNDAAAADRVVALES